MARMIPSDVMHAEFHGSLGEEKMYAALKALPHDYIVFHSIQWHKKNPLGGVSWGESDFTVFHPKRGLLVIEVKSGGIRCCNGRWTQINSLNSAEYQMKDPLIQASRSKFTFVDLLSPNDDKIQSYWVEAAVCFPSIEGEMSIGDLPPNYSPDIVITSKDMTSISNCIERIFDYYGMHERKYYTQEDVEWVVRALSPRFNAIPSISSNINEQEFVFNRMTQEQSALLDYLDEQRVAAIQGGAGTGKTMLAIEKAKRLAKNDKVLFLCFNKFLLDYLRTKYSNCNNIDFYNLPALSCSKMRRSDAGSNDWISTYLNSFDDFNWDYKHIVIDEGQDFLDGHILLLLTIAQIQEGSLYIFYDKNQLVQQRQNIEWINHFDCRLVLFANCRNTKSIATTSYRPIGIEKIKMRSEVIGHKPSMYLGSNTQQICECIAKLIRQYTDNGITKKDIVILTTKTEDTSCLSGLSSIGSYHLDNELNKSGILFTTARKFKGLEAPVVIMVDVDESTFLGDELCRVLYVGASRARHFLDLVCIVKDSQLDIIADALTGQTQKNPKFSISSQLKVKVVDLR